MYNNYAEYGWDFECYAWLEIGASTLVGFFAPGLLAVGSKAGKTGINTYKRIKRAERYKRQRSKTKQYNKIKKDFRGLRDITLTQGLWQFGKEGYKAVNDSQPSDSCDDKCQ